MHINRTPLLLSALSASGTAVILFTSLFVPVEYPLATFTASIAGRDAEATTYVFDCATATSCGPVTAVQGSSTARFVAADQPITTTWDCTDYAPPAATCLVSSASAGSALAGTSTATFGASGTALKTSAALILAAATGTNGVAHPVPLLGTFGPAHLTFAPGPAIIPSTSVVNTAGPSPTSTDVFGVATTNTESRRRLFTSTTDSTVVRTSESLSTSTAETTAPRAQTTTTPTPSAPSAPSAAVTTNSTAPSTSLGAAQPLKTGMSSLPYLGLPAFLWFLA